MDNPSVQCRLCAEFKPQGDVLGLEDSFGSDLNYKFEQCFGFSLSDEKLSKNVCYDCDYQVAQWWLYRLKVLSAQCRLEPSISEETQVKIESDIKLSTLEEEIFIKDEPNEDLRPSSAATDVNNLFPASPDTSEDETQDQSNDFKAEEDLYVDSSTGEIKVKKKRKNRNQIQKEINTNPERARLFQERSAYQKKVQEAWRAYKWKCCNCDSIFETVKLLQAHFTETHPIEALKYSCVECPVTFYSYFNFRRHVANHRNKYKYNCEQCGTYFAKAVNFKHHQEIHSLERNHMCSFCGKKFKTANTLRGHLKIHSSPNNKPSEPQFQCDLCNKFLCSRASLNRHKKRHLGNKNLTCELCGKGYVGKSSLQYHIQVSHSSSSAFPCEICGKTFKHPDILKVHVQTHAPDKKYGCETCGKRFHRLSKLKIHLLIHTGELPHKCGYCSKLFRLKEGLVVHERQHTGERPYECNECGHRFANCGNLSKHRRVKHGKLTKNDLETIYQEGS